MWAWEKKEVFRGPEKGRFFRICEALKKDNIKHEVMIQNLEHSKLMSMELIVGTWGRERPKDKFWYYIYVHKNDQERAEYWVRRTI